MYHTSFDAAEKIRLVCCFVYFRFGAASFLNFFTYFQFLSAVPIPRIFDSIKQASLPNSSVAQWIFCMPTESLHILLGGHHPNVVFGKPPMLTHELTVYLSLNYQ